MIAGCVPSRSILRWVCLALCWASPAAWAQHVSFSFGGGVGSFLSGGDGAERPNGHKMMMLGLASGSERYQLRLLAGSLERTRGVPDDVGDADFDYKGVDFVMGREVTHLPVALAIGVNRYEESFHEGYPNEDLGGQEFVHRWGPKISALRAWPLGRHFDAWAEADLHSAPYEPHQIVLTLNVGIGLSAGRASGRNYDMQESVGRCSGSESASCRMQGPAASGWTLEPRIVP